MSLQAGDKIETTGSAYAVSLEKGDVLAGTLFEEFWQAARFKEQNGGQVWEVRVVVELVKKL